MRDVLTLTQHLHSLPTVLVRAIHQMVGDPLMTSLGSTEREHIEGFAMYRDRWEARWEVLERRGETVRRRLLCRDCGIQSMNFRLCAICRTCACSSCTRPIPANVVRHFRGWFDQYRHRRRVYCDECRCAYETSECDIRTHSDVAAAKLHRDIDWWFIGRAVYSVGFSSDDESA